MMKLMHAIALALVPTPSGPLALHGMILTPQLTPTTPIPLLPTAPRMPVVSVPWPLSSMGLHVGGFAKVFNPCVPCGQVTP